MRTPLPIATLALLAGIAPAALATCREVPRGNQAPAAVEPRPENPTELGAVRWGRDLDAALAEARATGKPVFALFQEIPGCATCRQFGEGPLSHPLLVEAIEDLFVPVATYNNREGADAEVLKRFGEPSWNNPVVRFLDPAGADLIPRRDRVWSTEGIAVRAAHALEAARRPVPEWLTAVEAEADPGRLATATFTMYCFWSGEAALGALTGVVATRAAWSGGSEAVEVRYDPQVLGAARLEREAARHGCSPSKSAPTREARASDRVYYLRGAHRLLPLTPMQRTKVNAALGGGREPGAWISPRQRALLARIEAALEADPARLRGLEVPADAAELARYRRELEARLAAPPGR